MLEDIRLGQLALKAGLLEEDDLHTALCDQQENEAAGRYCPIGQCLVRHGSLTRSQLRRLLRQQKALAAKVTRIGRYRLLALRAEGGMGAVYKAQDLDSGLTVALKVLPRSHARRVNLLERFRREALSGSILDHPNIVKVLDADYSDGYHYIAMEYVQGMSTAEMLSESGRIPERDTLSMAIQIARALEHISDQGLVHRDIKPGNILVDHEGVAKLADMGLALWVERPMPRLTLSGRMMGTPFYISPEQARGEKDLDIRSDIYSFGTTLYELLTGLPPFRGKTAADILTQHLVRELPSPREIERTLSDGICNVITRMMGKEREDRYQSARELMKDLLVVYRGEDPVRLREPHALRSVDIGSDSLVAADPLPGETLPRERPTPLGTPRERRIPTAKAVPAKPPPSRPAYFYLAPLVAVALLVLGAAVGIHLSGPGGPADTTNFVFSGDNFGAQGWRGGSLSTYLGRSVLLSDDSGRLQLSSVAWETKRRFRLRISAAARSDCELIVWLQAQDGALYTARTRLSAGRFEDILIDRTAFHRWPAAGDALSTGLYYNLTLETSPRRVLAVASLAVQESRPVLVNLSE